MFGMIKAKLPCVKLFEAQNTIVVSEVLKDVKLNLPSPLRCHPMSSIVFINSNIMFMKYDDRIFIGLICHPVILPSSL